MIRLLILLTLLPVVATAQTGSEKWYCGMPVDSFKVLRPGVIPDTTYYSETIQYSQTVFGIKGAWEFRFSADTLDYIEFSSGVDYYRDANLAYENAFQNITEMFTLLFGKATKENVNEKDQYGTELIKVSEWETAHANIEMGVYRNSYRSNTQQNPHAAINENDSPLWIYDNFKIKFFRRINSKLNRDYIFYPGMTVQEFSTVIPELFPNGTGVTGQWDQPEKLYGLNGSWAFDFDNGRIDFILWNYYSHKLDKTEFQRCLTTTRGIADYYTKFFGQPVVEHNDPKYRNPDHHSGYEVYEATWKRKHDTIKLLFDFFGGKGEYFYLVKIEINND